MTYDIDIQIEVELPDGAETRLQQAVEHALRQEHIAARGVTVLLTDDETVRTLNRQFRDDDRATDVLSFPAGDDPFVGGDEPESVPYLGDIAISVPYAARQAAKAGHAVEAELQLLAVHGVLHLLGYDHESEAEKAEMWGVQRTILSSLGLDGINPTES